MIYSTYWWFGGWWHWFTHIGDSRRNQNHLQLSRQSTASSGVHLTVLGVGILVRLSTRRGANRTTVPWWLNHGKWQLNHQKWWFGVKTQRSWDPVNLETGGNYWDVTLKYVRRGFDPHFTTSNGVSTIRNDDLLVRHDEHKVGSDLTNKHGGTRVSRTIHTCRYNWTSTTNQFMGYDEVVRQNGKPHTINWMVFIPFHSKYEHTCNEFGIKPCSYSCSLRSSGTCKSSLIEN